MEHINNIIDLIINNFHFGYMITINVLTYVIIKIIDDINGDKIVPTYVKRIILIISIIIVTIAYIIGNYKDYIVLINSAILSPVFWSWIAKPIIRKFGIDYKNIDNVLN